MGALAPEGVHGLPDCVVEGVRNTGTANERLGSNPGRHGGVAYDLRQLLVHRVAALRRRTEGAGVTMRQPAVGYENRRPRLGVRRASGGLNLIKIGAAGNQDEGWGSIEGGGHDARAHSLAPPPWRDERGEFDRPAYYEQAGRLFDDPWR